MDYSLHEHRFGEAPVECPWVCLKDMIDSLLFSKKNSAGTLAATDPVVL